MTLVFGIITGCVFTASLTNSMSRMNSLASDSAKQFWVLRRFLQQHHVDKDLSLRILRYLEYANSVKRDIVSEERLPVLGLLTEQLASELKYVVHFGTLLRHPLLKIVHQASEVVMTKLVERVLSEKLLATFDVQFEAPTMATHMCMVNYGTLIYSKKDEKDIQLNASDWCCEQTL